MTESPPKPKRRWFQFSLRTLLIVTAIIAIALGWWSCKARQQRAAVAALRLVGATVEYDTRLPWTGGMKDPPKWPKWLLDSVAVDYFASVDWIDLDDKQITDDDLEHLKKTTLRRLFLKHKPATDAYHVKYLAYLNRLQRSLPNCRIVHYDSSDFPCGH